MHAGFTFRRNNKTFTNDNLGFCWHPMFWCYSLGPISHPANRFFFSPCCHFQYCQIRKLSSTVASRRAHVQNGFNQFEIQELAVITTKVYFQPALIWQGLAAVTHWLSRAFIVLKTVPTQPSQTGGVCIHHRVGVWECVLALWNTGLRSVSLLLCILLI